MNELEVASRAVQVLWIAFAASAVFGAVAQKSNFCTMGAISDAVLMGDYTRARQWACAAAVACIGFGALVGVGWIDPSKTLYASPRLLWLSAALGGIAFGFGMVLASGCGSKTLVRLGAGNLKSLVVLLVMGVSAFATLKGVSAVIRVGSVDKVAIDLGTSSSAFSGMVAAGLSSGVVYPGLSLVLAVAVWVWCFSSREFRKPLNWLAGFAIGALVALMWWVSGRVGFVSEHPVTLEAAYLTTASGRMEAMSFVAPVSASLDWLMFFSDKSKVITLGVASVFGVLLGSFVTAVASKSFRWEGFRGAQDTALHIVGATLMGVGGVTAMGCTVGQGLSGISTLSWMSMVAVLGIVAGGVLGVKFQAWLLERSI